MRAEPSTLSNGGERRWPRRRAVRCGRIISWACLGVALLLTAPALAEQTSPFASGFRRPTRRPIAPSLTTANGEPTMNHRTIHRFAVYYRARTPGVNPDPIAQQQLRAAADHERDYLRRLELWAYPANGTNGKAPTIDWKGFYATWNRHLDVFHGRATPKSNKSP